MIVKLLLYKLILLFYFTHSLAQQNYIFKVLAIQGNITTDDQVLSIGSEVKASQNITLHHDSSYVALYYAGKKEVLELTKKGVYQGQDLVKQLNALKGWESDFFYYALKELSQEKTFIKNPERRPSSPVIALLPTEEQKIYGHRLFFRWFVLDQLPTKKDIVEYNVFINDAKENMLYYINTKKNYAFLELASQKFINQPVLFIHIVPVDGKGNDLTKGYKSETYKVSRLDAQKAQQISEELSEIFKGRNRDTAFSKLAEARFFEDKRLPLDAIQAFEQALSLSFYSEAYKQTYRYFLERNGYPSGIIDK